jgi:hypothetical protein
MMGLKYRGVFRLTYEKLHEILGLPESVQIMNIDINPKREILSVILRSDEAIEHNGEPLTYGVWEAQEFPEVTIQFK